MRRLVLSGLESCWAGVKPWGVRADALSDMSKSSAPTFRGLPIPARILIPSVLVAAGVGIAAETMSDARMPLDPWLLVVAALLCAAGNLFDGFVQRPVEYVRLKETSLRWV